MIENILQTAMLGALLAYILRLVSPDDVADWWKITVVILGGVSVAIGMVASLIKIWS